MTEEIRGVEALQQALAVEFEMILRLVALTEQERTTLETGDYLATAIAPPEAGSYTAKGQNQVESNCRQ